MIAAADFTGSTAHMIDWVQQAAEARGDGHRVLDGRQCAAETPDVELVRPCNLCPHMKRITLAKNLDSLLTLREEVTIDPLIAEKARRSVERMINLKN